MAGNLTNMIASIFSGSAVTADPYYEYTTLLLPGSGTNGAQNNTFLDSSTNNFTITRNGNTTQGTFSPFSQTGWGNYFDGSGDYLSVADNAAFNLGSNDWCIEFFVYKLNSTTTTLVTKRPNNGVAAYPNIFANTSNQIGIELGGATFTTASSLALNAWTHIAVVKNGSGSANVKCYINGTADANTGTLSSAITSNTNALVLAGDTNGNYMTGYMSNFRMVNGSPVYTANFTPPTAPLTAISGTSLLTCQSNRFIDNSTNNFTITRNGDTRVVAFSPFNPTASWSATTYGGSGYFDGSGDYLAASSTIIPATGDVTIETWLYPTVAQISTIAYMAGAGASSDFLFYYNSSGATGVEIGNAYRESATGLILLNTWQHLALTKSGSTYKIFLNGSEVTLTGGALAGTLTQSTLNIGGMGASNSFAGYLSNLRITQSIVYTANFTPPTAPLTAITNTSLLLNFTNAGVYDATSKNDLETVGDAQISNAVTPKWGSTSIKFDGTGDYLQMPDSELVEFGSADFTIEAWVYPTLLTGTNRIILGHGTSGTQWLAFYIDASGYLTFYAVSSSAVIDRTATSRAVSLNTWTHVAVSRSGSTFRLFIDGSEPTYTGSPSTTSSAMPNFAAPFRIGAQRWDGDSGIFQGYIQDMRITKYARYTANFTPPTAAFPTL